MEQEAWMEERLTLVREKLKVLAGEENRAAQPFRDYFMKTAEFLLLLHRLYDRTEAEIAAVSMEELQQINQALYGDIEPAHYGESNGNPSYAAKVYGQDYGPYFSMLYAQLRAAIPFAFEKKEEELLIFSELFVQIACLFEGEASPPLKEIRGILYAFFYDYSDLLIGRRTAAIVNTSDTFALRIIEQADGADLRYLYAYGEYVTAQELRMAAYIAALPEDAVRRIAAVYAEGFLVSFEKGGKDRSGKHIANMRYHIGTERIVRCAMERLAAEGFSFSVFRKGGLCTDGGAGYESTPANRQYLCDHASDLALILDKPLAARALDSIRNAFADYKDEAKAYGGPVCLETFGEAAVSPGVCRDAVTFDEKQRSVFLAYTTKKLDIVNQCTEGENRSFTIMALPLPEASEDYDALFQAVCRINTLDSGLYETVQQRMIDALDGCACVKIRGKAPNRTDLTVRLARAEHPETQTLFENCVADVNIPVGEIFTTPVLEGTEGTLFVGTAYLDGLLYRDLEIRFEDGRVAGYGCGNFADPEDGRAYVLEHAFSHHEGLPMGEFAIGTNTTAYALGKKYGISARYPILIAEKTGPHFAVGDTCYSHEEDQKVIGPNGKEMIAKDNAVSVLRRQDPGKAYFGCHMDITIPYDELDSITGIREDGSSIPLIYGGRFVLPGTEILNQPLDE